MNEKPKTLREKSVEWQNRYLTPILLVVALCAIGASWAAGGIAWWLAIVLLAFGAYTLVSVLRRSRQ